MEREPIYYLPEGRKRDVTLQITGEEEIMFVKTDRAHMSEDYVEGDIRLQTIELTNQVEGFLVEQAPSLETDR